MQMIKRDLEIALKLAQDREATREEFAIFKTYGCLEGAVKQAIEQLENRLENQ